MTKSQKGQLRRQQKIREALKEFLVAADNALCKSKDEVLKAIYSNNGHRMAADRVWEYTSELVQAQRTLISECLSALSASVTSEKDLVAAMWDAASRVDPAKSPEDIFFTEVEVARTVQKTFLGPNHLVRLANTVHELQIGAVKIISIDRVKSKIEAETGPFKIRLGNREGLQREGTDVFLEFPRFAWEVSLLSSDAYAREEAQWKINIALSLMRLALVNRGGLMKGLFPHTGDVEPSPLAAWELHFSAGIILSQGKGSFGGSSTPHWYEIDSQDVKYFNTRNLSQIADVVFDPPSHSVGERLSNGLGWMSLARQTSPRAERFIHFFTAIEALLTQSDPAAPVTQTIARYLACLASNKPEERVSVADTVRRLYAKRSQLIHGGKRSEIHLSDAVTIQHLAEGAYSAVILNVPAQTPAKEFLRNLDQATYGAPWPPSSAVSETDA
jgi:hypothetical protein